MKNHLLMGLSITILCSILVFIPRINTARASDTIYIRSNGSIDPSSVAIERSGNTFTLTSDISDSIVVERSNIVIDGAGYILEGDGTGNGLDLSERSYVTIRNLTITDFNYGIWLAGSSNNNITGNKIVSNDYTGISLRDSSDHNNVVGNNLTDQRDGIELRHSSHNDLVGNSVSKCSYYGIACFESSDDNSITENNMTDNREGVYISQSTDNHVYHNRFTNNTSQADTYLLVGQVNFWDNGYPSGGNFWSDYNGTDSYSGTDQNITGSDKIGDTPYIINSRNQDQYPLFSTASGDSNWLLLVAAIVTVGVVVAFVLVFYMRKRSVKLPPPPPS
ncbi:right-handed parallel beta-helix repeat-containing protein [Candidatus Bathyarchaeota archaeon]|nr:right-handed parallel beta-helix repeat-containing protein [Candidatus Bathyarchaeota archaeon]